MATVNIRRDVTDPFYRYKMEKIQSKIEGKGNGIKTVVANLSSVSHSLARDPAHVIKYFGFELGAQTNNGAVDDRWIINGAHEAGKLQDQLDGFINKFVLCKKCKNPETDMSFPEGRIVLKCKACGERSDVDPRLKLSSFILKNAPKKGKKDKSTKKAERKARKEREAHEGDDASNGGSPHDSNSDHAEENGDIEVEANSDDELTRRINSEAKQIDVEETKEVEWSVDTSEAAVKARAQELPDDFKRSLVVNDDDDDEEGGNSALDQLGGWILEQAKEKKGGVGKVQSIDIYVKAKDLGIEKKHKTLTVLAQTIFDENILVADDDNGYNQIEKHAAMLKKMIGKSDKHEKAFLGGLERFIGMEKPQLLKGDDKLDPEKDAQLLKKQPLLRILKHIHANKIVSTDAFESFLVYTDEKDDSGFKTEKNGKYKMRTSTRFVDKATSKKVRGTNSAYFFFKCMLASKKLPSHEIMDAFPDNSDSEEEESDSEEE